MVIMVMNKKLYQILTLFDEINMIKLLKLLRFLPLIQLRQPLPVQLAHTPEAPSPTAPPGQ
jgi:hypothetical protein